MRKPDVDLSALRRVVERLFPSRDVTIERMAEGTSTQVYRLRFDSEIYYPRVAEAATASLAPEAAIHQLLRARGVRVPAVIHFEPFDQCLQRSLLVTTEIRGESVKHVQSSATREAIVRAAGRDLAILNSIPVHGFGWITRDGGPRPDLQAEHPTNRAFMLDQIDRHLGRLCDGIFTESEIIHIRTIIADRDPWLDTDHAFLAHGDFDLTHIYQCGGRYTGIIDFGEIRGTAPLYDLGHFNLHDGETVSGRLLPALLDGYREAARLPADCDQRIRFTSLMIGIEALVRSLRHGPTTYSRYLTRAIRAAMAALG
ncbi:MAG TPA: aminoglycoside phosphotransferase family protein [Chloroflexota bacterium]|nr:aminoglycoside phosphotransferase family protein [Chloroflexota bacterium]